MNELNVNDFVKEEEAKASEMAVNVVHFDDQDHVAHRETVPLAHYLQDMGLTSEAFLARHQKLRARRR